MLGLYPANRAAGATRRQPGFGEFDNGVLAGIRRRRGCRAGAFFRGQDEGHQRPKLLLGDGLNLASFRESSELEFGADDAFILVPDENADYDTVTVTLRHLKARHTAPKDLVLEFDRRTQRFAEIENPNAGTRTAGRLGASCKSPCSGYGIRRRRPTRDGDQGGRR